jgi:hypothetical protein
MALTESGRRLVTMCYESWYQRKQTMDEDDKAKKRADEAIEKARLASAKPKRPLQPGEQPVAETEETVT